MPGTKATGYMPPVEGGFCCANCEFFAGKGRCGNKEVVNDPQMPKTEDGKYAQVKKRGCCNEFAPEDAS